MRSSSNITGVTDNVHKNSSGNRNFDALYTLDELNRLIRAEEGTLSGGSISNRSRDERWQDGSGNLGLSQTGNWLWHEEADSTREERRYYCQNWRADVVALLTDAGKMVEWVKYSSYGVPFALPAGDTDSDGDFDATDLGNSGGTYDVREDVNLDGTVDTSDAQDALVINNGYVTLGRGVLSNPVTANRKGYAGYEYDPTFEGAGRHLYHVRHRVYDADVGRWTRRDPLGYVDGMSLYSYVQDTPLGVRDSMGLCGSGYGASGRLSEANGCDIDADCISAVNHYIEWNYVLPRCRLEPREIVWPPQKRRSLYPVDPSLPVIPELQIPRMVEWYIVCDPADPCEDVARKAGYECCKGESPSKERCIAATFLAWNKCKNPTPPPAPPGSGSPDIPPGFSEDIWKVLKGCSPQLIYPLRDFDLDCQDIVTCLIDKDVIPAEHAHWCMACCLIPDQDLAWKCLAACVSVHAPKPPGN